MKAKLFLILFVLELLSFRGAAGYNDRLISVRQATSLSSKAMAAPMKRLPNLEEGGEDKPVTDARLFDGYRVENSNDEYARLDGYAIELNQEPGSQAYIIAYDQHCPSKSMKLGNRVISYLNRHRGIEESRLTRVSGGYRSVEYVELWIVPTGAALPKATPETRPRNRRCPR